MSIVLLSLFALWRRSKQRKIHHARQAPLCLSESLIFLIPTSSMDSRTQVKRELTSDAFCTK